MNTIKISYDQQSFKVKPSGDEIGRISNRIARSVKKLNHDELKKVITRIGSEGCTFSPATFKNGKRSRENFEQQQLFVLDFDNKGPGRKVSFKEIKERADSCSTPILTAYSTLSSTDHDKYRVIFLNDVPIYDRRVAEDVQLAIGEMFPEADPSCYKDVSKLYFGGKEILYYDDKLPEINIESIFRSYTYYMKKKYKDNHYKEHIARFSNKTGIALNKKGLLDVISSDYLPETDNPTEGPGVKNYYENGKNSPTSIIYDKNDISIKENGEIFPNKYYRINFNINDTRNSSVKTPDEKPRNHEEFRSGVLQDMNKCRLFHEFVNGSRKLSHDESFGIATNLIHVESGTEYFIKQRLKYPNLYTDKKNEKWREDLRYISQLGYCPKSCDKYCPYHEECTHCKNILNTVHTRRGSMEKVTGYHEEFSSIKEMQDDIYSAVNRAFHANNKKFYIIKAQTGGGKSYSYLRLMEEHPEERFLIAAPTNLLKDEIYEKAEKNGIDVLKTPSLEQIKDEIPGKVWRHIQKLYKRGQHHMVHRYIDKIIKSSKDDKEIRSLKRYMKERQKLQTWNGNVITTHRYLLTMDGNRLDEYDAIIIDEDIIFKSIISNQGEITVSKLEKLAKETADSRLKKKIKELLKTAEKKSCIKLEGFEWDSGDDESSIQFDIPSFCKAEYFYMRRASDEEHLKEDTVAFFKPAEFPAQKYIIVSATADEDIYQQFFSEYGEGSVDFYGCKKAKYKGTLYQYPQKSMSRSCIANNAGIIRKLIKKFGMGEENTITFMKEGIGELHFGNTEGSNTLEGEDILVVGTPYHAEFLYKLTAFALGFDFDEDEEMERQTVQYNGYQFLFRTYRNEGLRAVQFWMLESELEQAVGRARLLRKECEVHLFSNFPLSQSSMVEDFDYEEI